MMLMLKLELSTSFAINSHCHFAGIQFLQFCILTFPLSTSRLYTFIIRSARLSLYPMLCHLSGKSPHYTKIQWYIVIRGPICILISLKGFLKLPSLLPGLVLSVLDGVTAPLHNKLTDKQFKERAPRC